MNGYASVDVPGRFRSVLVTGVCWFAGLDTHVRQNGNMSMAIIQSNAGWPGEVELRLAGFVSKFVGNHHR